MCKILTLTVSVVLVLFSMGCGISSTGVTAGPVSYNDYDNLPGYNPPPTGLPISALACKITYPADYQNIEWDGKIWIYAVIWREGEPIDDLPWGGPLWEVDFKTISDVHYRYDQAWPEVFIRFMFDAEEFGPGQHEITLTAWDQRDGGHLPTSDSIILIVD